MPPRPSQPANLDEEFDSSRFSLRRVARAKAEESSPMSTRKGIQGRRASMRRLDQRLSRHEQMLRLSSLLDPTNNSGFDELGLEAWTFFAWSLYAHQRVFTRLRQIEAERVLECSSSLDMDLLVGVEEGASVGIFAKRAVFEILRHHTQSKKAARAIEGDAARSFQPRLPRCALLPKVPSGAGPRPFTR